MGLSCDRDMELCQFPQVEANTETINAAVNAYLDQNPPGGMTDVQVKQLDSVSESVHILKENNTDLENKLKDNEQDYNLYNPKTVTASAYINSMGSVNIDSNNATWVVSDFIDLTGFNTCVSYNCKIAYIGFYDENKQFLERLSNQPKDTGISLIRENRNAQYIRINYITTENGYDTAMVCGGEYVERPYVPYHNIIVKYAETASGLTGYTEKKVLVMGDSIMSTAYAIVSDVLEDTLQPSVFKNIAVPGATWCDSSANMVYDGNPSTGNVGNCMGNQVQKLLNLKNTNTEYADFDVCIIGCGTNDGQEKYGWSSAAKEWVQPTDKDIEDVFIDFSSGSIWSRTYLPLETVDRTTIIGAMRWCVEKIQEVYPTMKIFISVPIQTAMKSYLVTLNRQRLITRVAERMACEVIDTKNCGIYDRWETENENGQYLQDGLHPNIEGGRLEAKYICRKVACYLQLLDKTDN